MPRFDFRYVAHVTDFELGTNEPGFDREKEKAAAVAELLGYTTTIHPTLVSVTEVPFRGTDLEGDANEPDDVTDTCLRVEWTGWVEADYSDATAGGDNDRYRNSAEGRVDEGSWTGGEHGWGYGSLRVRLAVATTPDVPAPALD